MKICSYIVPLLVLLAACQREESPVTPEMPVPQLVEHTLYASTPDEDEPATRTVVSTLNDKKILWSAQEQISILSGGGNYLFQGDNDTPAATASFTGTGPADLGSYIALYPYNLSATYSEGYVSTTLPAYQLGKAGSFGDGYLITADDATGNSLSFKHLCSGLRFMVNRDDIKAVTIRGNNGEKIAGDFRFRFASEDTPVVEAGTEECVTLQAPGGHFAIGTLYYIVILPTVFSNGFTLTADNGSQVGELRFDSEVTFSAGKFKNITGALNTRISSWKTPKIYYGPQNSFCLRPGGSVSIDVTPRMIEGTWERGPVPFTADVPDAADVLWGNGSISSAALADGKLTVTASDTPGSALVAIKKNGTILWSYLIWVTAEAPASIDLPSGAKLQEPLGGQLYFQWGRKDPLLSSAIHVDNLGTDGLAYSIAHPTEFINEYSLDVSARDWFSAGGSGQDSHLWGADGAKTVWEPCPQGYRVPSVNDVNFDFNFLYDNFAEMGYISNNGLYPGRSYWTRTPYGGSAAALDDGDFTYTNVIASLSRVIAAPVRCIKE